MIKIKEGFKRERLLSLPEDFLKKYQELPLISNLFVRKIGFFPSVKYHYINKEQGAPYYMLIYCTAGKGWYEINRKRYEIHPNQFVMLPKSMPYSFGSDLENPWTIYWLHFDGSQAKYFVPGTFRPQYIHADENSRFQDRMNLFEEIYNNFSMAYTSEYMLHSSMCLYNFLSSFLNQEQYQLHSAGNIQKLSFATRVIYYMQQNVTNNLSLEEMAHNFKYSPSHFSALFQKETGLSPVNYYIRLKIQKACEYIVITDMKFSEISILLGFKEAAYFTRLFTKVMGLSPSEYRKKETLRSS